MLLLTFDFNINKVTIQWTKLKPIFTKLCSQIQRKTLLNDLETIENIVGKPVTQLIQKIGKKIMCNQVWVNVQ